MILENTPVLVTGAGGFIGSHLCRRLVERGAHVRCLVRYNSSHSFGLLEALPPDIRNSLDILSGDIRDPSFVRHAVAGCRVVFHLAALIGIPFSYEAPRSYVDTNIGGTVNVLEACLEHNVERLVHTSTSEVYGSALYTPIDEKHPLQAQSPYSASKIAADKMAESFFDAFNLPVVTIRPFNCFGPRQSARAFIPAMISQALREERIRCGSLSPRRDYTYVRDTVEGFLACAVTPDIDGAVINIGSGRNSSMGDLLDRILALLGVSKEVVQDEQRIRPDASEVAELLCDNALAARLLDWHPLCSLDQGLSETIAYVESNLATYKTRRYAV